MNYLRTLFWLSLLIPSLSYGFSCNRTQAIYHLPIRFNQDRLQLTQEYQQSHYGIKSKSIGIEPKIIVLHWTNTRKLKTAFQSLNPVRMPKNSPRRKDLPGDLNVSAHFLVDRDGRIYQLMPDNWMARHVIGINHYAIGIENVGGINDKDDLTPAQLQANAVLICYLKRKYPAIRYVIGHNQYLQFKNSPYWLERSTQYQTDKHDPGPSFVRRVLRLVHP